MLFLSQYISEWFINKPNPGSLTIFATIDFSKAFHSAWHCPLFHKLILIIRLNLSFLTGAFAWFLNTTKVTLLESVEVFRKGPFLAPCFFLLLMIFLHLYLLSSAALFMIKTWLFGPSTPQSLAAVEAKQKALIRLKRRSEDLCLPLNPRKYETSFFLVDSH